MVIVRCWSPLKTTRVVLAAAAIALGLGAAPTSAARAGTTQSMAVHAPSTTAVVVKRPVTTVPQRDWVDYMQIATVLAAVGSALLIWRQLRSAARTTRQERAADAADVWSNRKFLSLLSPSWAFLEVQDVEDCISKVRAWVSAPSSEVPLLPPDGDAPIARRNDIKYVIGVIEDVSVRYNRKEIDRDWVERMLAPRSLSKKSSRPAG